MIGVNLRIGFSKFGGVGSCRRHYGKRYLPFKKTPRGKFFVPHERTPSVNSTDIVHYSKVETSHLHEWKYRSQRRNFNLLMEDIQKAEKKNSNKKTAAEMDGDSSTSGNALNLELLANRAGKIRIEPYVQRSPTDLLKAIASGLVRDVDAPDYRTVDDPYLKPYSYKSLSEYVMSKESGRRAARYIFQNHPELFQKNKIEMIPKIPSFMPKMKVTKNNASLDSLSIYLEGGEDVQNAIAVYQILKEKDDVEISPEIKLRLLEMICFNGENDPMSENSLNIYGLEATDRPTWSHSILAESLARELEETHPVESKLALLKGFAKYGMIDKVPKLFDENKAVFGIQGYNAHLFNRFSDHQTQTDNFKVTRELIIQALKEMKEQNIKPNDLTFFYIFRGIYKSFSVKFDGYWNTTGEMTTLTLSLLAEMKKLGITPSVGIYDSILRIMYHCNRMNINRVINDIIDDINNTNDEGRLKMIDPSEENFVSLALTYISRTNNKENLDIASRIMDLANKNPFLLNNTHLHNMFYNSYFQILTSNGTLEDMISMYDKFTPGVFQLDLDNYLRLINNIDTHAEFRYIPGLWTDLIASSYCRTSFQERIKCINSLILIASNNLNYESTDDNYAQKMIKLIKDSFTQVTNSKFFLANELAVSIINNSMTAALHVIPDPLTKDLGLGVNYDLTFASSILEYTSENMEKFRKLPLTEQHMEKFVELVIKDNQSELAMKILIYAGQNEIKNDLKLANQILKALEFSKQNRTAINSIFSHRKEWIMLSEDENTK